MSGPLLPTAHFYLKRRPHDLAFGVGYLVLVAVVAILPFASEAAGSDAVWDLGVLDMPDGCTFGFSPPPSPPSSYTESSLFVEQPEIRIDQHIMMTQSNPPPPPLSPAPPPPPKVAKYILNQVASHWYLPVLMVLVLLAMCFVWLVCLRLCAKFIVYLTVLSGPLALGAFAAFLIIGPSGVDAAVVAVPLIFVCICLVLTILLWIMCIRRKLGMTAALLAEATHVLQAHPSIVFANLGLLLLHLAVIAALVAVALLWGLSGTWVQVQPDTPYEDASCSYELPGVNKFGLALTLICIYWTSALAFAMRFFVTAFVTACWYFSPAHDAALSPAPEVPAAPMLQGLRLACTTSWGTLSLAGAVLAVTEYLNRIAQEGQRSHNLGAILVATCLRCFLRLIAFISKFALAYHALSGVPFFAAARDVSKMLARHALSVYVVDRIAQLVLGLYAGIGALVLSALVALCTALLFRAQNDVCWDDASITLADCSDALALSFWLYLLGAFLLAAVVTFNLAAILHHVVDALVDAAFTCHVLDLDAGLCNQPQLRTALVGVVEKKDMGTGPIAVVQQPAGQAIAYPVPAAAA